MVTHRATYIETRTHCRDFTNCDHAVQSLDFGGTVIDVSPRWLEVTGYNRSEVIGRHFMEFLTMKSLAQVETNFPRLTDFGYVDHIELEIISKNRKAIPVILNGKSKYTDKGGFKKTYCEITPCIPVIPQDACFS